MGSRSCMVDRKESSAEVSLRRGHSLTTFDRIFDLAFALDGKLVILKSDDDLRHFGVYKFLKIEGQEGCNSSTGIKTEFKVDCEWLGDMIDSHGNRLIRGSDGNLYLSGQHEYRGRTVSIYDSDLWQVDSDNLDEAIRDIERELCPVRIHHAIEHQGLLYFMTDGSQPDDRHSNFHLAYHNGEKIVAVRRNVSPTNRKFDSRFDSGPRIDFLGNKAYIKLGNNIRSLHLDQLAGEYIDGTTPCIPEDDIARFCIPSAHCIDADGRLYVVMQSPEEKQPSIKVYKDNHMLHSQPCPGGGSAHDRMALSPDGSNLAYLEFYEKAVHLFEVLQNTEHSGNDNSQRP